MSTGIPEVDKLSDIKQANRIRKLLQIRNARLDFARNHHINTKGEKMDFDNYPHIWELYNSIAPEIVIQGSVQSFKSEWGIIDHLACAYSGLSIFFVLPKYEHRNTYVQNRIDRCVQNVPEYKRIIGGSFFDNIAMKSFGDGVIKYVGSNVLADFTEFPADMIFVEEVDRCHKKNLEYAIDRMRASKFQFRRYVGNPDTTGKGINEKYQESDQREWNVPCDNCGEHSKLDWFETVVEPVTDRDGQIISYVLRDRDWKQGCGRDVYIKCPKCAEKGDDGNLIRASKDGKWIAENPESDIVGYHFSMLCSPINSIAGMWRNFQKALNDPGLLKQFYNSYLGLPFAAAGNKITDELLKRCVEEDYKFVIESNCAHVEDHKHPGPCSMGVDVGAFLDVRISYVEARGVRRSVYMGKVRTKTELYELMEQYNVERCVVDSMPEITLVQDIQAEAPCDVWLCRYHKTEGTDKKLNYDPINRIILVDRTSALDRSYAALRLKRNIIPENFKQIFGGKYVDEMCGPVRELVEDAKGNTRFEWSKCEDHQRHTDTYDMLAADMMMETVIDTVAIG